MSNYLTGAPYKVIRCEDVVAMFLAGVEEVDDDNQNIICSFDMKWIFDLVHDRIGLTAQYLPVSGIKSNERANIRESLPLCIEGTPEGVQSVRGEFDEYIYLANEWISRQWVNNSVWLYVQYRGEAGMKRSLVKEIDIAGSWIKIMSDDKQAIMDIRVNVLRHYVWEDTIKQGRGSGLVNFPNQTLLGKPNGSDDARISTFTVLSFDLFPEPDQYETVWVGIKPDVGCGVDQWEPYMYGHTSINRFTGTSLQNDVANGGSSPTSVRIQFPTTEERVRRVTFKVSSSFPLADWDQWRGIYTVLARVRVLNPSPITTISVQMAYGWEDNGFGVKTRNQTVVYVSNDSAVPCDSYRMISLGNITLPHDGMSREAGSTFDNIFGSTSQLGQFAIDILAGREQGGGNLFVDGLYLLPAEYQAIATLPAQVGFIPSGGDPVESLYFYTNEDDTVGGRYERNIGSGDQLLDGYDFSNKLFYPKNGGSLVMVVQKIDNATGCIYHDITQTFSAFGMEYYSRWLNGKYA